MIAANSADVITAVIASSGIVIAAVLPVLLLNRRTLKRTEQVVDETTQAMDTSNGHTIGDTTRTVAQTLTVVQVQGHENARSIFELHERIGGVAEQVSQFDDKLEQHLEEVAPLVARYKEEVADKDS